MHKLKENLKQELYEFEEKVERNPEAKMSLQELQRANLASDTVKNLCKIEILEEGGGYSEESNWMGEGRMYGTSYDSGSSYARGRGRNAKRDRMGRYSSDDGMSYQGDSSYARDGRTGTMNDQSFAHGRRYSRDGAKERLMDKAEEMLEMTQDPKERRAIEKFMHELEND